MTYIDHMPNDGLSFISTQPLGPPGIWQKQCLLDHVLVANLHASGAAFEKGSCQQGSRLSDSFFSMFLYGNP